jgi:hypothetical protein
MANTILAASNQHQAGYTLPEKDRDLILSKVNDGRKRLGKSAITTCEIERLRLAFIGIHGNQFGQ